MSTHHQARGGRRLTATVTDLEVAVQRAFLIGVHFPHADLAESERSLEELALLTDTAGSQPVDSELVRRQFADPATFIGKGKAEELAALTTALDIDVVVFDNALSPAQQRNLHALFKCDVVDREGLILDIFAQHAKSREGSLQVELALYRYNLPRLRGQGKTLSQQGAGLRTRGPGETKLETDRRRILSRVARLEKELEALTKTRATQRKARRKAEVPQIALVGYTNAGKSTLLNRLTNAEVLTEDRLFSTLDSTVRKAALPGNRTVLFSDTVGFVRRLPHHLVEAFRSTLDDVADADLLLHLVDCSDPDPPGQIAAVREVLDEIEVVDVPELIVFNKIDTTDTAIRRRLANLYPTAAFVSARTGEGIEDLLVTLAEQIESRRRQFRVRIPYARGDLIAAAHRVGDVLAEKHEDDYAVMEIRVEADAARQFEEFLDPTSA